MFALLAKMYETLANTAVGKRTVQAATVLLLFAAAHALAYQYVEWRYHVSPSLRLYLKGYLFEGTSLAFICLALIVLVLNRPLESVPRPSTAAWMAAVQKHKAILIRRFLCILAAALVLLFGLWWLSPKPIRDIKVAFLTKPGFDKYAFVYLIYELNRRQEYWHFDIVFDDFNWDSLSAEQQNRIESSAVPGLALAEFLAKGDPLIAVTDESLGQDLFFEHSGHTSVISTYRWEELAPPSVYEFVIFSMMVQAILIHLDATGPGVPVEAFEESNIAFGNLFQFSPKRNAVRAYLLAPHLSQRDQEVLLNRFGMGYLQTCAELIRLDWLKSEEVRENLRRCFNVDLTK